MHFAFSLSSMFGKFSGIILALSAITLYFSPINIETAALNQFSNMLLFFTSGILLDEYFTGTRHIRIPLKTALGLLAVLIISGIVLFEAVISPTRLSNRMHPFYFLYFSMLGIISVIGLSQHLAGADSHRYLKVLGKYSLQIYLVHMLAGVGMRVVLSDFLGIQDALLHMLIGVFAGLAAPVILYRVSMRFDFPYLFEFKPFKPKSAFKKIRSLFYTNSLFAYYRHNGI
jgi:peptidoglycan/LPS O-acetylase OafA/YrhL